MRKLLLQSLFRSPFTEPAPLPDDAAVAELARLNVPVMLAFNRRFDPSNIELRRAIDAGAA